MNKQEKALYNLLIASLLSVGYRNQRIDEPINKLYVPFESDKKYYLADYLNEHQLQGFVNVKEEANEYIIMLSEKLQEVAEQWFSNHEKIFKKNFLSRSDYQALIIYINLFGMSQMSGVLLPTNIQQQYLFTLCFTMKQYLDVDTIVVHNQIKITNTKQLFLATAYRTTSFDSSSIVSYLSKKEVKDLKESLETMQTMQKKRKNIYA